MGVLGTCCRVIYLSRLLFRKENVLCNSWRMKRYSYSNRTSFITYLWRVVSFI